MDYPKVTVIIPMRNEERFIGPCLESILANDYPMDRVEILVMDGRSTDRSAQIVLTYAKSHPNIRLLDNPDQIIPAALNLGIRNASGEIIIRADAHAQYAQDYIRQCVELLLETGAGSVGGAARARGTSYLSWAISYAVSSRFGSGDAKYRYSNKEEWVDTVFIGAWRRETLERVGGFNVDWLINEDYEFNVRLRKMGYKILLSPRIRCEYFVRDSLSKLARQYFRYGFWKVKTLKAHPESLRWRQLAAPCFVVALMISLLCLPFSLRAGLIIPLVYSVSNLLAGILISIRRGWRYLPATFVVFATIHICWGIGFIAGIRRFGMPRVSLAALLHNLK